MITARWDERVTHLGLEPILLELCVDATDRR
jgi:hypothetical protein